MAAAHACGVFVSVYLPHRSGNPSCTSAKTDLQGNRSAPGHDSTRICWHVILQVPGLASNETSDSSSSNGSSSGSTVSLEVGSGWVQLRGPSLPQLAHMLSKPMAPWDLLQACQACGLHLTPGSKECRALGLPEKEAAAEPAMCVDLAALW